MDGPRSPRERPATAPAPGPDGYSEQAARLAGTAAGAPCRPVAPPAGATAQVPARTAPRLALALGGLFALAGSGSSAAAVALPGLGTGLDVPASATAWVLSVYVLALAVTTAVYGRLADLAGVRWPLVAGVGLMAGGAVLGALAPSLPVLLVGRMLQGAGAGAVPVLATALLSARYTGEVRAAALTRVAGVAAAGGALGPFAGGLLQTWGGWRAVLVLPAVGLLLLPLIAPAAGRRGRGGPIDVLGAVLVTACAAGLVLLVQSPAAGVTVAVVGAALLAVAGPAAAVHLARTPLGFLPRRVVTSRAAVTAAGCAAVVPAGWFGLLLAVPEVLTARGWSPLLTGASLVPAAAVGLFASRYAGRLLARAGAVRTLALASALTVFALLDAAVGAAVGIPALLAVAVGVVSAAFSLGQPALVEVVGAAVPAADRGVALGAATLLFLLGGGVGTAAVAGVGALTGTAAALAVLAVLPAVATLVAGVWAVRTARTG
ncbi:MFS transporter [Geodermatophilus sp. DSM 44513]|uniref:MFS transporter n=1 Tax=Geodermatophilus sp. DSM 44513 TaxID=1528104 RepID=UPI0028F73BAC|nr:MFS transporter [Geodermatophilus sp. DSM 44513]WNV73567.1 MFS transporter [Geodermatophilus sp. DSM 44513]